MPIRLVIADDHPIVLDGLVNLFRAEPDVEVAARCVNGEEALQAARTHRPDICVLDVRMPRMDALAVLREIGREGLGTKVVLLATSLEDDEALEALRLGVRGIVLKEMAPELLVQCVRKVYAGEQWLEKHSSARALGCLIRREAAAQEAAAELTPRELELVRLVALGLMNKEIADRLAISEGTVKVHMHHVYEKLKVENRVELTLYAQEKGLV